MRRKSTRDSTNKPSNSPNKFNKYSRHLPRSAPINYLDSSGHATYNDRQDDAQDVTNSVSENVDINAQQIDDNQLSGIAEITAHKEEESEKGKSNIVKTNVEQYRDIIEPEIENENVQGTAQSPSNDNDENVQNVNDFQTNPEENEANQQIIEEPQQNEDCNFESEYTQGTDLKDNECSVSNTNDSTQDDRAERSTTPEPVKNELNISANSKSDSKVKETERKKIILRRSPPLKLRRSSTQETSERQKKERRYSIQESNERDTKDGASSSKKIILKRPTVEEKNTTGDSHVAIEIRRRSSLNENGEDKKRRVSTSAVEKNQESGTEETSRKPTTKVKINRSLSSAPILTTTESTDDEPAHNSRKPLVWGKSNDWLDTVAASTYKIDMDSIKTVCPSVKFLNENEIKFDSVPKERKKSESETLLKRKFSIENNTSKSEAEEENGKDSSDEESGSETAKENIIAMNRKISIVDDTASKLKPPPSPANNPVSNVLFITNLVRPFTVKQLKELLERTGKIKEDGFWTDRIKSKCYVQYHNEEEAETTRNALHGVNWPIGNGKQLCIDYSTEEALRTAQNPVPAVHNLDKKLTEKENWEPESAKEDKHKEKERFGDSDRRRRSSEREPHRGKDMERRRSKSRNRDRTKERKYGHRSYTPDGHSSAKRQKKDEPAPQKLMDDLFLKTKATPSIYWQPLSPEEIATKQKQRLVRMEEHKRRIEQTRERRIREPRRPPYRRR